MSKPVILLAIDGRDEREALATQLDAANIACQCVDRPADLVIELDKTQPATVIVDISFGGHNAHHLLHSSAHHLNGTPVVFRARRSASDLELALEASLSGAGDFLLAPHDARQLGQIVERARCYFAEQQPHVAEDCKVGGAAPGQERVPAPAGLAPRDAAAMDRPVERTTAPDACSHASQASTATDVLGELTPLQRQERLLIIDALSQTDDNVVDAARLLKMGQATIYRKIRHYQISHTRRRRKRIQA